MPSERKTQHIFGMCKKKKRKKKRKENFKKPVKLFVIKVHESKIKIIKKTYQ